MASLKLSAVLITLNEEANIERSIRSVLPVADEVLVVDSFSTDATVALAAALGARVVQMEWLGFAETKNRAHALAHHDWIFSLDADEELDPDLIEAVRRFKQGAPPEHHVGQLDRRVFYCGHEIRHSGWAPDRKVRLFHRGYAHWVGAYVHETLAYGTPRPVVVRLSGKLNHYTVVSLADHLNRIQRYTDLQAQEWFDRGKRTTVFFMLLKPVYEFVRTYVVRGGFRDGIPGLMLCLNQAFAKYLRQAKLLEKQRQASRTARPA
jgi:glycosyltransferase involved in cell wall biosynthesis